MTNQTVLGVAKLQTSGRVRLHRIWILQNTSLLSQLAQLSQVVQFMVLNIAVECSRGGNEEIPWVYVLYLHSGEEFAEPFQSLFQFPVVFFPSVFLWLQSLSMIPTALKNN